MASRREFYTLVEAAQVLGVSQRHLLVMLETGKIEGERDPQSSRWKVSKHDLHEFASEPLPADQPSEDSLEGSPEGPPSTETVQELIDELGNLRRELGHLKSRLEIAQQAENAAWQEEKELLLAELEQEREERRREREQAESTLQAERDRLLEDQKRERERADELQEESNRLREKLETERSKRSWRKLFG